MNQQHWHVHLENVQLRQENRRLQTAARRTGRRTCVYCARPTWSQLSVCRAHRDLPALDPGFT